jgi:hypothetical protein
VSRILRGDSLINLEGAGTFPCSRLVRKCICLIRPLLNPSLWEFCPYVGTLVAALCFTKSGFLYLGRGSSWVLRSLGQIICLGLIRAEVNCAFTDLLSHLAPSTWESPLLLGYFCSYLAGISSIPGPSFYWIGSLCFLHRRGRRERAAESIMLICR